MTKTTIIKIVLVAIIATCSGISGYALRAATTSYTNQYCYSIGEVDYTLVTGSASQYRDTYHITCSSTPLPQTP